MSSVTASITFCSSARAPPVPGSARRSPVLGRIFRGRRTTRAKSRSAIGRSAEQRVADPVPVRRRRQRADRRHRQRPGLRVFDEGFRFRRVGLFHELELSGGRRSIYPAQSVREVPPTTCVSALPQGRMGIARRHHSAGVDEHRSRHPQRPGRARPKGATSLGRPGFEAVPRCRCCSGWPTRRSARLRCDSLKLFVPVQPRYRAGILPARRRGRLRRPYFLGGRRVRRIQPTRPRTRSTGVFASAPGATSIDRFSRRRCRRAGVQPIARRPTTRRATPGMRKPGRRWDSAARRRRR